MRWGLTFAAVAAWAVAAAGGASASTQGAPRLGFFAAAGDVLIGDALAAHGWKDKIASPNEYGQYEVLVRKGAAPRSAPACRRGWLILRMPAALDGDAPALKVGLALRRAAYAATLAAVRGGKRAPFDVTPDSYYRRTPDGGIALTGCNLFLLMPGRD